MGLLRPITRGKWDRYTAAHLLNRAGFGGTPEEIAKLAGMSPHRAVDALVDYHNVRETLTPPSWIGPDSDLRPRFREMQMMQDADRRAKRQVAQRVMRQHLGQLRRWWIRQMVETQRPLQEKLTLFWHGHFATSFQKVKSTYSMYRQNQTFREHAVGNWRSLLLEASKEPAMLLYLDNAKSRKRAPNENFARELMELFTLGEGHYSEQDIKESARALTGWSLDRERFKFMFRPGIHDRGLKQFMGRSGNFKGDDIIDIILAQKQSALFISRKLWEYFVYPNPESETVEALAAVLRGNNFEFKPLLKTMFKSEAFYSEKAIRTQIKSPVHWLVSTLKVGALDVPAPRIVSHGLESLGQDLFNPPNVKGWDGGYTWITAASLVQRYRYAGNLLHGRFGGRRNARKMGQSPADADRILPGDKRSSVDEALDYLMWRVYQGHLRKSDIEALRAYAAESGHPDKWTDRGVRDVVQFMMSTPAYQVA